MIKLRMEWETMLLLTVIAAVGDALTMPMFGGRGGEMPYCAVVAAAVFFGPVGKISPPPGAASELPCGRVSH